MDNVDCLPQYLNTVLEYSTELYDNSNTLLTMINNMFGSTASSGVGDFIRVNNAKSAADPVESTTAALLTVYTNIDKYPAYLAYYWIKKFDTQIQQIQTNLSNLLALTKSAVPKLSDSIGTVGHTYSMYNDQTTPYYSYLVSNIKSNFYIPGNTFNKLNKDDFVNVCLAGKYTDIIFKHNLAPSPGETNKNLIQSSGVNNTEYNELLYISSAKAGTTHGDNLVTDINTAAQYSKLKMVIKTNIFLLLPKISNIIMFLKGRVLQSTRNLNPLYFNTVTSTDYKKRETIIEQFDILQQKLQNFANKNTIEKSLK